MNIFCAVGRLTSSPEYKKTPNGTSFVRFTGKRGKNKLQIVFKLIYQNKAPLRCGADLGACGRSEDTKI